MSEVRKLPTLPLPPFEPCEHCATQARCSQERLCHLWQIVGGEGAEVHPITGDGPAPLAPRTQPGH